MPARLRSALVVVVGLLVVAAAADRVVNSPAFLNPRDFLEYWAAGAVVARGGNPYDPAELLAYQRLADPDRDAAVMMWNPPWSLAVYAPVGLLPVRWATLVWVGLQLAAVMVACDLLWGVYGGPGRLRWVPQVLGLTFAPVVWTILYGQNTGLLLLGLAGFVYFRMAGKPGLAGACAALTALKPHLLAAFGVLLILDALTRRGAVALAAGAGAITAALGFVLALDPGVVSQFAAAVRHPAEGAVPLTEWVLPVAAYWLRYFLAPDRFWVQFVPCAAACAAVAVWRLHLWRRGRPWDWPAALPVVVWASVLATPYGGWVFDLAVLLVPVVAVAARLADGGWTAALAGLAAGFLGVTAASLVWAGSLPGFFWVAPAVLVLCLAGGMPRPPARGS
ncbi:MAG TPA: glycosyltransferase family 87 protein [Urbifossiella sp.]|nr:glycosyltransferase family 87 protein [Urbifossiella sp.]